ncbi:beta strand repeat-containing protein, partial [Craurococcus roseus]|uniref:beta strand repeat-containing protein n=1 Tax=Craurococcus roseus TaxID=77585 RepID=UPI0031E47DB1
MVVAWAQTNADLDGVGINRTDGGAPDGAQSAPAIADNTAEFFAVAWVNGTGATKTIRAKFYDSLGNPDPLLPGPIDLNDATGAIVSGPVLAGWIEGYTAAWREQAVPDGPVLYRARLIGPEALVGQEFSLGSTDPDGYAVLNQDKLSMAGWEQILDPVAETVAVGFNALWVSTVGTGGGATLDRIMLQRFEVPLDALRDPQPAVAGGIDGRGGTGSDAAVVLGAGRDPSMAALHDGQQVIAWIDGNNRVQGRFLNPDGTDVPGVNLANFATVAASQGVKVAAFGVSNFGIFWVAAEGGGLVIKGQTWGLPDGAANWAPLGPALTVVALPAGFDGRFSVAGFGEGSDAGVVSYSVAGANGTQILAQAFDPLAMPSGAPFVVGTPGGEAASKPNGGMAGLVGERAAVVWQDAADGGDIRVQIIDTRATGVTLVGDRPRDDGRVDARVDVLVGTTGDDLIVTDRGDTRGGRSADDQAHGVLGDDTLYGGGGNDLLDGGEERLGDAGPQSAIDTDTAAYRGGRGAYSVTVNGDGSFTVKDMRQGIAATDGMDTVEGFEQLAFGSQIAGPTLTVGPDRVGMDTFFQALPSVAASDGTPKPWGLDDTAAFTVNADPTGAADPATGAQTAPSAVGLLGGFAFAWQSGDAVLVKAYDTLGRPDAAFGGVGGARVFTLTDGVGAVTGPVAAMAGETGVVAVWQESVGGGASAIKGRFVSAVTGLVGNGEFQVEQAPAGVAQRDAAVAGYEVVDAANDTAEHGFLVGYTQGAGADGVGRVLLDRQTLYVRAIDGFDVGVAGERAPASVGLDGFVGVGSADDGAAYELSAAGRNASLSTLHDGEVVASWIEGGTVKVKILIPAFNTATGITAFDASRPVIDAATGIDAGTEQQVVGLGFNFAVAYMQGGVFKAQLYTGSGGAWTRSDVVSFGAMPAGTIGDVSLVATDLDGTAFTMFVEAVVGGATTVHGQHFDGAGHKVGQAFVAFQAPVSLSGNGAGGFSAAPLDDGRIVIAAEGQSGPGADASGIVGALLDTRTPGEPIIGPRDGAPRDVLVGTTGDDAIDGRVLEDELHGGLGNDVLLGGSENDTLSGEKGDDTLLGGSEDDSLLGGDGDDLLMGGFGVDVLAGGAGSDTVSTQGEFSRFRIDLAAGTVRSGRDPATGATRPAGAFAAEDTFTGIENATGGEAADAITGDGGGNVLQGRGGNDTLDGAGGTDTAVFRGIRADYTASFDAAAGTVTVSHARFGADGVDQLKNVELFRFADGTFSLADLLAGNAASGVAVDGYIAGGTLFWDADGDRVLDTGEASTTTGPAGGFSLAGPGGALVLRGGLDTATLLASRFTLEAPAGSTVVSPLTTLVARIAAMNGGDVPAARDAVLGAFGLPAGLDLTSLDPIQGMLAGNAAARATVLSGAQVIDTLTLLQAAGEGFGLVGLDPFGVLASRIMGLGGGRVDLTHPSDLAGLAQSLGLGAAGSDLVQDSAAVAAASNASAAARFAAAPDPLQALVQLAAAGIVARGAAADALRAAAPSPAALQGVVDAFTGAALAARVNGAVAGVGDVDGDGDLDGAGIALSNASVAENAAGAVVGALSVAAPAGTAVAWEVLNGGLPDGRFTVDTTGGTPVLRLQPGITLDHEAQASVTATLRATFEAGGASVSYTRDLLIAVQDKNEPVAIAGGTVSAALVEDRHVPAPPALPVLTAAGGFGFSDPDAGTRHGVTSGFVSAVSSDPAVVAMSPLGQFAATLGEAPATGSGAVTWTYEVNNDLLQQLGAGDTLTETYRVSIGTNAEFAASSGAPSDQREQQVARLAGGGYVVAWTETRPGQDYASVYARVFGADGTALGADLRVNTTLPEIGAQLPSVAALSGGGFVVVWQSDGDAGALPGLGGAFSYGVTGQVFSGTGAKLGGEFQANTSTVGNQTAPRVVALASDRFLVTWTSEEERLDFVPETGTVERYFPTFLQGQAFQAGPQGAARAIDPDSGEPAEFRITPLDPPAGEALLPSIEGSTTLALAGGGSVIAWSWTQGASQFVGVVFQAYDGQGRPVGGPVTANLLEGAPSSAVLFTAIGATALADGGFALAWQRG